MPEIREGLAHHLTTQWGLEHFKNGGRDVLGIWADAAQKEEKQYNAQNGLPGSKGQQSYLLAVQLWSGTRQGLSPEINITDLHLLRLYSREQWDLDLLFQYWEFLEGVAKWVRERFDAAGSGLVSNAIRSTNTVWVGVGAYTVACLCAAVCAYAQRGKNDLKALLCPTFHGGVLAPSMDQWKCYRREWLHIWGKEQVKVGCRMAELVDEHMEPAHLKTVLTGKAIIQTGHLMFGNEWADVAQLHGLPEPTCMDPLTCIYLELGALNAPMHLKPGIYRDHLFVDLSQTGVKRVLDTYAYKGSQTVALCSKEEMIAQVVGTMLTFQTQTKDLNVASSGHSKGNTNEDPVPKELEGHTSTYNSPIKTHPSCWDLCFACINLVTKRNALIRRASTSLTLERLRPDTFQQHKATVLV
ncbi:hypothetical protein FA15DRAFT_658764 [Coprinopsis marcescibilis]|uniref:Uncharacterized protein n=1 Tax=Coprinopsis marcescibilis TaxID=230819 RepID=A0A5C3KLP8_COPMA|nr:hypothetical protein FA15DRAFT_658764 [Coprinopsis marcescibilis]